MDLDALAQQHQRLPVERQVPSVLAGQHVGDHRLGRQPALDQSLRRRCLHDGTFAGSASVFGPDRDDHSELRRDDVEPLGLLLADDMHRRLAARAGRILGGDDDLDARQMKWQRWARLGAPFRARCPQRRILLLFFGFAARHGLLDIFQGEL